MSDCIFCNINKAFVVAENNLAFIIYDNFPVTPLHSLIIPKRHARHYFDLTQDEVLACDELLREMRLETQRQNRSVQGFNIGMNVEAAAGQTIFHCHIHLIPRREGDVENPRGGVRHLIPGKGYY
jgi:diadenosine tetraphosphate (Ap4A) HIT family hydrolase